MALVHTAFVLPIAFGIMRLGTLSLGEPIILGALNLNASWGLIIRKVIIPELLPFVVSSILFCFAISWDEFSIAWFLSGFDETVPIFLWNRLRSGLRTELLAVVTFSTMITALVLGAGLMSYRSRALSRR